MKLRVPIIVFFSVLILAVGGGCVPMLVGGGLAGGVAVSMDTIRLDVDVDIEQAWETTKTVVSARGEILSEIPEKGLIIAKVGDAKVSILIAKIIYKDGESVWIDVSARRRALPHMALAAEIIDAIDKEL
jgi:hypothetical protein